MLLEQIPLKMTLWTSHPRHFAKVITSFRVYKTASHLDLDDENY